MSVPPGLYLNLDFVSPAEEEELIRQINASSWNTSLKRLTQHYGYEYNYNSSRLSVTDPIPNWIDKYIDFLHFQPRMNQVIINRYLPGEGISPHIDKKIFGDNICSLSLGSECVMRFEKGGQVFDAVLPRRSLVTLSGEVRNEWTHQIPARKSDNGKKRETRYSLTFRSYQEK